MKLTYKMLGADPWGGDAHLAEFSRELRVGELVYVNSNWFRVLAAGLSDCMSSDCDYVAKLEKVTT